MSPRRKKKPQTLVEGNFLLEGATCNQTERRIRGVKRNSAEGRNRQLGITLSGLRSVMQFILQYVSLLAGYSISKDREGIVERLVTAVS